ncbi:elongation of very long chain fatty acids protein 7-like isoform X2 [Eupeodes corollae]|uniref:elongation of very long chain fatty acids protein 7-like isoform X2 n=1 Tax=Eupeodes corollae TaxID=290404 RepID=UPI00248F4D9C|nr:elongation of very long chain fatty acids protein 7-like isoform X2 [Eupeodes corollae]
MVNFIEKYFDVTPDPRSIKLDLMGSPLQILIILTIYVCFVKKWGPLLMKNRKPFELKAVIIVYNIFQVLINGYLVYAATPLLLYHRDWVGSCLRIDETDPEIEKFHMRLSYLFCMIKILDLCDTIFFVLRKHYQQISFLHLYHHLMVGTAACLIFRYVPNGHLGITGYVNSFVHTIMYVYYLISILSPNLKQSIWWKKYITVMQMVQFVFVSLYILYPWMKGQNCGYPFKLLPFALLQNFVLLYLFSNFYIKTYRSTAKSSQ